MKNSTLYRAENPYMAPTLTVIEPAVEQGIAFSGDGSDDYTIGGGGIYTDITIIENGEY